MATTMVVYVHGMWMPAEEMAFVRLHLKKEHRLAGKLFDYPSIKGTLDENAELLDEFVRELDADEVHFVGHSLGGVLSLRTLALNPQIPPGRVVCLGSPLTGSRAAEFLHSTDWGSLILGNTITDGVVHESANDWATDVTRTRDIGVIAGTKPVGLGRLVANFNEPNDGTVAVSETRLDGAKHHLCMDVTHTSMVLSADVADQTAAFLKTGAFLT